MTAADLSLRLQGASRIPVSFAGIATVLAFLALYSTPLATLARDWWIDPEAGHGLLLAPLAAYLAWKSGLVAEAKPLPVLGLMLLVGSVFLRYASGLASELFTMRLSMMGAAIALVVFSLGIRQMVRWWLPALLLMLSIPLPAVVLGSIALPLQMQASRIGAALLEWRHVPVLLTGNVIHVPGRSLFVTEACSGLRSLTALLSLGLLVGGLWLTMPWMRALLLATTIPVAILLNGLRIFLTGFLVVYVDPRLGEGLMHYTEGWVMFVLAFAILGGLAAVLRSLESLLGRSAA